jgi:HSP20 family protein
VEPGGGRGGNPRKGDGEGRGPGHRTQKSRYLPGGRSPTIKGEKKSEREETKESYHLVERSHGSFSRALRLPAAVDADKIGAQYEKGVLTITCPKKEVVQPKAITIKTT